MFVGELKAALEQWKKDGRKGAYMELGRSVANLIPIAVELGFNFHHANVILLSFRSFENYLGRICDDVLLAC